MTIEAHITSSITPSNEIEEFKAEVLTGLSFPVKELSADYCYDQAGTQLLNQISKDPTDYPTACEAEILQHCKDNLALHLYKKTFNLIELGTYAGINSNVLIKHFLDESLTFTYSIVNPSATFLETTKDMLKTIFPSLKCHTIHQNYLSQPFQLLSKQKNIILLLNSAIGKIPTLQVASFLKQLRRSLYSDDILLIGFDLRKNINELLQRYNASNSLYAKLYLNLLERINKELGGNFNVEQFTYFATYNKDMESINHFLISQKKQSIYIPALKQAFDFQPDEVIYLGAETKYRAQQIITLAEMTGFEVIQEFSDNKNRFIESVWEVKK